ncbi:arginase family protein [Micromonospora sp. NPDC003197]
MREQLHKARLLQSAEPGETPTSGTGILGLSTTSLAGALRRQPAPDVVVVGAAVDLGSATNPGARHGPEVLRRFSSPQLSLTDDDGRVRGVVDPVRGPSPLIGRTVLDIGDLFAVPNDPRQPRHKVYSAVEATVRSIAANGIRPLVLGGDHSITAPAYLATVADGTTNTLVVLDAHLDAEEPGITQFDQLTHVNFLSQILATQPQTTIYVLGARDLISPHLWPLPDRLKCLTVDDGLDELGRIPPTDIYLSVDADVLDPAFFPATGHPVPGGLSVDQLLKAIETVGSHHSVVAADLVEAVHSRDHDYTTGQVGGRVVRSLLEAMVSGVKDES